MTNLVSLASSRSLKFSKDYDVIFELYSVDHKPETEFSLILEETKECENLN